MLLVIGILVLPPTVEDMNLEHTSDKHQSQNSNPITLSLWGMSIVPGVQRPWVKG